MKVFRCFSVHWHLISTPKPPDRCWPKKCRQRRIRSVLRLMPQLPLCAVKSNPMLSLGSRHAGSCMSLQPSLSDVAFKRGNISTCFDSHPISLNMKFCVTILQNVINKCVHHILLSLSSVSFVYAPPHTHVVSLKHPPTPPSSFHPSLFLCSHCDLELHAARRRTKWLASLLFCVLSLL